MINQCDLLFCFMRFLFPLTFLIAPNFIKKLLLIFPENNCVSNIIKF